MSERPTPEATPPRVWDDPEKARVTGSGGGPKKPPSNLVGAIVAWSLFIGIFGFLWGFPTTSLVFLLNTEPVQITVTDCFDGSGKGSSSGCDGTWTLADGTTGESRFTGNRAEFERGDVVDGVHIGGRAALSTTPWVLDVAIVYPIAFLLTGALAAKVVRDVRREKKGLPKPDGPQRPPVALRILGWSALVAAYVFLWGFPTYSAFAMVTAEPVAITVSDCLNRSSGSLMTRCHGEWTLDGKPGDGSVEVWSDAREDGVVIDGTAIGERVVHVPLTWILDLVVFYPLAALLTYVHLRVVRKARLAHERRDAEKASGTIV